MTQLPAKPHAHQLRKRRLPPIEWLRERFSYDPVTGTITGTKKKTLTAKNKRYLIVTPIYEGKSLVLYQHRLAFALMRGRWPHLIDHINGAKNDNRWCNLREVSCQFNAAPKGPRISKYRSHFRLRINGNVGTSHKPCVLFKWREAAKAALTAGEPMPQAPVIRERP